MRIIFYILLFQGLFCLYTKAQNNFVTLNDEGSGSGSEFRLNGQRWFAVMANYEIDIVYNPNNSTEGYFVAPKYHYGVNNGICGYESTDKASSLDQIHDDFVMLALQGFNSVRIYGGLEFGKYIKNGNPAFHAGPTDCYSSNGIEEEVSAPYTQIFDLIQMVVDQAESAGIKIQFHTGFSGNFNLDDPTFSGTYYVPYLQALATRFANSPTIFSYDFRNEPASGIPRQQVCDLISSWHNAVDQNSPQLTTVGFQTINPFLDIRYWDPGFAKLDFVSYHIYKVNGTTPQSILDEVKTIIRWCSKVKTRPWMIGETGFAANTATNAQTYNDWGTEGDQATYAEKTLEAVRDWGGIGYAWWNFQDLQFQPNFGLYRWDQTPKAVLAKFSAFSPVVSNSPPAQPSNYYTNFAGNGTAGLSGTILDQNGNPVEDAIVLANQQYFTFTKSDGTYIFNTGNVAITQVEVTAVHSEYIIDWNIGTVENYALNTWLPASNVPITGPINSSVNYEDYDKIITSQLTIANGVTCNMKAGVEIDLQGSFESNASEFHAYISPMFADCFVIGSSYHRPENNTSSTDSLMTSVDKINDEQTVLTIYPNPGTDMINISIADEQYKNLTKLEFIDNLGRVFPALLSRQLNVSELSNGFYLLKFTYNNGTTQIKSFIKTGA